MKKNHTPSKVKKGFTLTELLVVIAILAVLTTVAIVGYSAYVNKAKETKAQSEVQQLTRYISAELLDINDNEWKKLDRNNTDAQAWENAIKNCDKLKNFTGSVSVNITNGVVTITYTLDGKSASAIVK